ncbi:hypothetical protein GOODEAATRI_024790, partial [Goodea atripinnis]
GGCPHLTSELAKMKALLQSLQADSFSDLDLPFEQDGASICDEDIILVVALGTLFWRGGGDIPELSPRALGSESSASQACAVEPVWPSELLLLACRWTLHRSSRLHPALSSGPVTLPPLLWLLHWRSTSVNCTPVGQMLRAFYRLMTEPLLQEASRFGLGQMPAVEPGIASLLFLLMRLCGLMPVALGHSAVLQMTCSTGSTTQGPGRVGLGTLSVAGPVLLFGVRPSGPVNAGHG